MSGTVYCVSTGMAGQQTLRFYDARDQLVAVKRPGGKTESTTYNPAGGTTSSTNPSGNVTTYTYDDAGRLKDSANGDSRDQVSFTYDADGHRASMTDATGTTSYTYDRTGKLTRVTDGAGNQVSYALDDAGRVSALTYPSGRVVSYTYNPAGDMSSLTDDTNGQTTGFDYDDAGALTSTNLPNGNTISTTLDDAGQPTSISMVDGSENVLAGVAYGYDHAGRIATETGSGALSRATSYDYDAQSRLTTSTDTTTSDTTDYGYDPAGNPVTFGAATQTFDVAGQLETSTSDGVTTDLEYDGNGDRTRANPTSGPGARFEYDRANRMVSSTRPDPDASGSLYHPVEVARLVNTSTGTGTCTPSPCAKLPAGGSITIQVGGKAGVPASGVNAVVLNVTAVGASASGYLVAFPADEGRPSGRSLSMTTGGPSESNAVVTGVSSDGKVTLYSNVATDLLIEASGWYANPGDSTGSIFEPINGRRVLDTRNGTGTCTPAPCARLAAGATTTVQVGGQGGVPATGVTAVAFTLTTFNPDQNGFAVAWNADQTLPSLRNLSYGASTDATELIVAKTSTLGRVKLYTTAGSHFALDVVGYYTTTGDGTGSIFVPYDGSSGVSQRILDTRNGTGSCDPAPCTTLSPATPVKIAVAGRGGIPADANAVVVSATAWNPTGDGGMVFWSADDSRPPGRHLSYAAHTTTSSTVQVGLSAQGKVSANALTSATDITLDVQGWFIPAGQTTTYRYNGDGLRASKTTDGDTISYTYNTATPVPQLLTDGDTDYIYGPTGTPLEALGGTGSASYYLTDALGSTRALAGTSGAITGTYNYTPYGAVESHTGTATTALQYAGGYTDPETSLNYLINRYYDPNTGVFTTTDPLLDITNQPYTYADNNPTNLTDPTGQCPWCLVIVVGALIGGGTDLGIQIAGNLIAGCPPSTTSPGAKSPPPPPPAQPSTASATEPSASSAALGLPQRTRVGCPRGWRCATNAGPWGSRAVKAEEFRSDMAPDISRERDSRHRRSSQRFSNASS